MGHSSRTILMHVGQGKTGSSYLQSCLALSIDAMAPFRIAYPIAEADRVRGEKGHVNMGNFRPRSRETGHFAEDMSSLLNLVDWNRYHSVVVSNEGMYLSLNYKGLLPSLLQATEGYRLKFKMVIRDPFEHALSVYQQGLKANLISNINEHFAQKYNVPVQTRDFIYLLKDHDVDVSITNYSRHKKELLKNFEQWIGLPAGAMIRAPRSRVNRSLTRSEMEFQRAFNRHAGPRARLMVADFLSNELPEIKPENPYIDHRTLETFLGRMRDQIDEVNTLLPANEAYQVPDIDTAMEQLPSEKEAGVFALSAEQIETLARGVSRWLRKS